MKFSDLLNITRNMIDETDTDSQIDVIIKSAINKAYLDLCSKDRRLTTAYIPIINGVATLPDDLISIETISPSLEDTDKLVGNSIVSDQSGIFTVIYSYLRDPLVNDTDEPELNLNLQYALCTYACYKYFEYRKKGDMASMFYQNYINEVNDFEMASFSSLEEAVKYV